MVIGIDARLYGKGGRGIGRYLENLIRELEKADLENRYVVFMGRENWDEYVPANCNFSKALADFREYGWKEQAFFPGVIRREGVDLMHFPHFNVPVFFRGKFVVTIHDLIPLRIYGRETTMSNILVHTVKRIFLKAVFRFAIHRSESIVAVSEYTKSDLLDYFRVSPEKISVVYEGGPQPRESLEGGGGVPEKYGIAGPYVLYVGAAYPHKNLERLLEAFDILEGPAVLVLAGKGDGFYERLRKKAGKMESEKRAVFAGYVPDADLPGLYAGAGAFVFPSLCEGFGLPPLEAMACGTPVISSEAPCLPEILGDAAEYFDPENVSDMALKIGKVLGDGNLSKSLSKRGLYRLGKFSWKRCAKEMALIYRESLEDIAIRE